MTHARLDGISKFLIESACGINELLIRVVPVCPIPLRFLQRYVLSGCMRSFTVGVTPVARVTQRFLFLRSFLFQLID